MRAQQIQPLVCTRRCDMLAAEPLAGHSNNRTATEDDFTMAETVRDEISQLAGSIRALERQLELALAKRRVELNYEVRDGIAHFEQVVIAKQRLLKRRLLSYIIGARPAMILTAPRSEERRVGKEC